MGGVKGGGGIKGPPNRLLHRSVVSAGRRSLPRGQVEGAAAASAGFQRASFRTLIASAFCPPSYRSPPPPLPPTPGAFPFARTGVSVASPAPPPRSVGPTRFREADIMSYTPPRWWNRKQLARCQRSRGDLSSSCLGAPDLRFSCCRLWP